MPSFRVLQQRCSHFSLRFRCSRIEIRPDINNLIKKITIKRPCEFGTRNTYACFKSHKGATQRLIMPLNTAPLFSYLTFPFRGFVALVVPWCPESPAQISRGEMFVVVSQHQPQKHGGFTWSVNFATVYFSFSWAAYRNISSFCKG